MVLRRMMRISLTVKVTDNGDLQMVNESRPQLKEGRHRYLLV